MPNPRPWTKSEKMAAVFFIAAHTANAFTTEAHQDRPELHNEINPILGTHPTDTEVIGYFSLTGALALGVAHLYPEIRKPLLIGYGGVNTYWSIHDIDSIRNE